MRILRILIALALAVIGIIIFIISLLFRNKKKSQIKENAEGERYLGKYEVKRE